MKLTLNGRTHEVELTADGITVDGQVFVTHVDGFGAGTRMVNVNGRNVRVDFGEDTEAGRVVIVEGQEFTATLVGTVRTFDPLVQEMVENRLKELCNAIALGFGATATVHYERIYPATINTESEALFAGDVAESLVGADHVVRDLEPSMGAEDFSFMLQTKPGAYLRIGQGTGSSGSALHNSRYDFNDDILPLGSALHASLIEQAMPLPMP